MASVAKRTWTHKGVERMAWVVRYTDNAGKNRLKSFDKKRDADLHRTKVEAEVQEVRHVPEAETVTVAVAAEAWLASCVERRSRGTLSENGLRSYRCNVRKHIVPSLGSEKLTRLSPKMLQAWADNLKKPDGTRRGRSSYSKVFSILKLILTHAQRHGLVGRNIMLETPPHLEPGAHQPIVVPEREQVRAVLGASEGVMVVILHLAVLTGLRQGEIFGLHWRNVDLQKGVAFVRQAATRFGELKAPKTRAGIREVPLGPALVTRLKAWKLETGAGVDDLVVRGQSGGMMKSDNFHQHYWRPFMRQIGLALPDARPTFHFHALRHAAAALFIEQGLPPKRIQQIMGHSSIVMTFDLYGYLFQDDGASQTAAAAIERLLARA